jgi:hypothetical protein
LKSGFYQVKLVDDEPKVHISTVKFTTSQSVACRGWSPALASLLKSDFIALAHLVLLTFRPSRWPTVASTDTISIDSRNEMTTITMLARGIVPSPGYNRWCFNTGVPSFHLSTESNFETSQVNGELPDNLHKVYCRRLV